jgi:hypothetical protein
MQKTSKASAKDEVDRILPSISEKYNLLDEEDRAIVDVIISPKKYLYGERTEAVQRLMDSQYGSPLYTGVHLDKLCDIIKTLVLQ